MSSSLVKRANVLKLLRDGHRAQVVQVPGRLEIAAADEQINLEILLRLNVLDRVVDLLQLPVSTSFDSNLHLAAGYRNRTENGTKTRATQNVNKNADVKFGV